MPEAVIVSAVRTPVGRAPKGALATTRPDDLAAIALSGALDRVPALDKSEIDDVILGCAQPEGEQGFNIARFAALRAGLPVEVPGVTVNRLCASGSGSDCAGRYAHSHRHRPGGDRGRRRVHEHDSHGRIEAQSQSLAGGELPGLAAHHGADGGAGGAPLQGVARRPGRLRAGQPSEGSRRAGRGAVRGRTGSRAGRPRPRREPRPASRK